MKITPTNTRIILSGLAGAGKSSVGKALAELLGFSFRSAGHYAREEADRRGITIQELQKQLEDEPEFDQKLDNQLVDWGKTNDCWIMDYRLGFALIPEATSVYLTVKDEEAVRRIADAGRREEFKGTETTDAILASIRERNENMRTRLLGIYDIDFTDQSRYDHIIATDGKSVEQVVAAILHILESPQT